MDRGGGGIGVWSCSRDEGSAGRPARRIRSNDVADHGKQVWIGTVEVRPEREGNDVLGAAKGAFVTIVTWAADADGYRHNAELVIGSLDGLFLVDVLNAEPVDGKESDGQVAEEIDDLITRARANPDAILWGTFHTYQKDDG